MKARRAVAFVVLMVIFLALVLWGANYYLMNIAPGARAMQGASDGLSTQIVQTATAGAK